MWDLFYGKQVVQYQGHLFKRAVSGYVVTFLVALLLCFCSTRRPWTTCG